jgi:hypothetical protein
MPLNSQYFGRAYGALRSHLGRTACAEGWGVTLFDFVAEHGRAPKEGDEREACRDRAAAIAAAKADWPGACRDAHDRKIARFERIAHGLE